MKILLIEDEPAGARHLFQRFSGGGQGNGLGLAICEAICRLHGWRMEYRYGEGEHCFRVCFREG